LRTPSGKRRPASAAEFLSGGIFSGALRAAHQRLPPARPYGPSDARSYPRIRKSARNTKARGFELSAWMNLGLRVVDRGRLN